jgi:hypothetical protein
MATCMARKVCAVSVPGDIVGKWAKGAAAVCQGSLRAGPLGQSPPPHPAAPPASPRTGRWLPVAAPCVLRWHPLRQAGKQEGGRAARQSGWCCCEVLSAGAKTLHGLPSSHQLTAAGAGPHLPGCRGGQCCWYPSRPQPCWRQLASTLSLRRWHPPAGPPLPLAPAAPDPAAAAHCGGVAAPGCGCCALDPAPPLLGRPAALLTCLCQTWHMPGALGQGAGGRGQGAGGRGQGQEAGNRGQGTPEQGTE